MAESEISTDGGAATNQAGPHVNETVLRSEIAFWQEMIGTSSDALPPEAVERMHHALALAEKRLSCLYEIHGGTRSANVIHLDRARRHHHD